jgi:flagellar biosynthesis/type III secretory pathway protein FliH
MAEEVVEGFTRDELEMLREISLHRRQMDYQEDMLELEEAHARGLAEGLEKGLAQGQKQLIDLLESGKSLEEAKRILGFR